ncbi:hypothetical protein ACLX1H_001018 [Fusarium chlamydosporum]
MTTALSTSLPLLFGGDDSQTFVAEVLGADATATTYLLNCPSGTDGNDCGTYNNSVTVGPWASKTLAPGAASTGELDLFITVPSEDKEGDWRFSVHCDMSRTIAKKCTTINIGGNNDGTPTATLTNSDDLEEFELTHVPVVITAGLDLLNAKHTGVSEVSATTTATTTATSKETASTPTSTSGASSCFARVFGAMSAAGIAAAL